MFPVLQNRLSGGSIFDLLRANQQPATNAGGTINVNRATNDPARLSAAVTRGEWQEYLARYQPVELEAIKEATRTDFTAEGNAASAEVQTQTNVAAGSLLRQVQRTGGSFSAEEQEGLSRRLAISGSAAQAGAETSTRRGLAERNLNALGNIIAMGRGIQNNAAGGLSTAAELQGARENANRQMKAQQRAQMTTTAGSLLAMAIFAS